MLTKWKDKQLFSKGVIAFLLALTFMIIVPIEVDGSMAVASISDRATIGTTNFGGVTVIRDGVVWYYQSDFRWDSDEHFATDPQRIGTFNDVIEVQENGGSIRVFWVLRENGTLYRIVRREATSGVEETSTRMASNVYRFAVGSSRNFAVITKAERTLAVYSYANEHVPSIGIERISSASKQQLADVAWLTNSSTQESFPVVLRTNGEVWVMNQTPRMLANDILQITNLHSSIYMLNRDGVVLKYRTYDSVTSTVTTNATAINVGRIGLLVRKTNGILYNYSQIWDIDDFDEKNVYPYLYRVGQRIEWVNTDIVQFVAGTIFGLLQRSNGNVYAFTQRQESAIFGAGVLYLVSRVDYGAYTPIYTIYARDNARVITEQSLGWHLTNSSSTVYCPIIAEMAAGFADSVYNENLIRQSLEEHGFEYENITTRHTPRALFAEPSYAVAYKYLACGTRIVAIIFRGSQLIGGDLITNAAMTTVPRHSAYVHMGYDTALNFIMPVLSNKLGANWHQCNNTIYFITGHSYGGAAAILLARELELEGTLRVPRERIFTYTFASPRVARTTASVHPRNNWASDDYTNIFNIINSNDLIARFPMPAQGATGIAIWYRFGRYITFTCNPSIRVDEFIPTHAMGTYLNLMQERQTPIWHATHVGTIAHGQMGQMAVGSSPSNLTRIVRANSPINITVLDNQNNIIGTIINNTAWHDENFFGSAILTVEDEGKFIYMPAHADFRIALTATDEGTMEFDVVDINSDTGEIVSVINFENIPLEYGKEIITHLSTVAFDTRLFVVEDNIRVAEITTDGRLTDVTTTTLRLAIDTTAYTINGVSSESDVAPFIDAEYERTMIPLYLIAEVFDADIEWLEASRTVKIMRDDVSLTLQIDTPLLGGMGQARIVNSRAFVPIRYISETFGASVRWDGNARAVYIDQ